MLFLWSAQSELQSEMFITNSIDMVTVVFFTGCWAVWAVHLIFAQTRPARKESNVPKLGSSYGRTVLIYILCPRPTLLSPKDKGQVTHPKIIIFNEMRGNCQKDSGAARLSAQWAKSFRMFFEKIQRTQI